MGISGLTVILTATNFPHQLSVSSVVVYQFLGGNDSTSDWKISIHLIQIRFSSDNAISPSLNKFNQSCMDVKYEGHTPVDINPETIYVVLD